jgi:ribosomal 50S subunit-recycling heat shock protein
MRLDKYLKVARLIKRRTVANEAVGLGRVLLNGREVKPSAQVKAGDILTLGFGVRTLQVRVEDVREHALKADAAGLYTVISGADEE